MLRRFKDLAASWNLRNTASSSRRQKVSGDKSRTDRGAKRRPVRRKRPGRRLRHCDLEIYESRLLLTFHLWKMDQVFSSADGKVQFIEMHDPANGENHTGGHFISSGENTFTFPADLPSATTADHHFLIERASYRRNSHRRGWA